MVTFGSYAVALAAAPWASPAPAARVRPIPLVRRWFGCRRPRFGRHGLSVFIDRRFSRSRLLRRLRARRLLRGCGRLALSHTVADCASVV